MHTPGPWVTTKHNGRIEVRQKGDEWSSMIAHVYSSGTVNGNFYKMPSIENARLIATAPELLEACKYIQVMLDSNAENLNEIGKEMLNRVNVAIAKAEGK